MNQIEEQISKLESELAELRELLPDFERLAAGQPGSKKYRAVASRIVLSSRHLDELVKEHTFSK